MIRQLQYLHEPVVILLSVDNGKVMEEGQEMGKHSVRWSDHKDMRWKKHDDSKACTTAIRLKTYTHLEWFSR